jgi:ankyrin repeat protein
MRIVLICFFITNLVFSQKDVFDVARTGNVVELQQLIKENANCINEVSPSGYTPLILATYRGNTEVAKYLINEVKDIDFISTSGTALMAAVMKQNLELIKLFVSKKANLNIQDNNGTTALMLAITVQNTEIIKEILVAKPDLKIKDKNNKEALDYALKTNNQTIIKLFNYEK